MPTLSLFSVFPLTSHPCPVDAPTMWLSGVIYVWAVRYAGTFLPSAAWTLRDVYDPFLRAFMRFSYHRLRPSASFTTVFNTRLCEFHQNYQIGLGLLYRSPRSRGHSTITYLSKEMQVTYDTSSFAQQLPDTVQLGVRGIPHCKYPTAGCCRCRN